MDIILIDTLYIIPHVLNSETTMDPTKQPSPAPTDAPTSMPSKDPTDEPSPAPTDAPTGMPTDDPTYMPSPSPTNSPTSIPSASPTAPTESPVGTRAPTQPSLFPTLIPSNNPTKIPSLEPSDPPSKNPSQTPTNKPSAQPTNTPSNSPSKRPSKIPSSMPSMMPSRVPSSEPTGVPSQIGSGHYKTTTGYERTTNAPTRELETTAVTSIGDGDIKATMPVSSGGNSNGNNNNSSDIEIGQVCNANNELISILKEEFNLFETIVLGSLALILILLLILLCTIVVYCRRTHNKLEEINNLLEEHNYNKTSAKSSHATGEMLSRHVHPSIKTDTAPILLKLPDMGETGDAGGENNNNNHNNNNNNNISQYKQGYMQHVSQISSNISSIGSNIDPSSVEVESSIASKNNSRSGHSMAPSIGDGSIGTGIVIGRNMTMNEESKGCEEDGSESGDGSDENDESVSGMFVDNHNSAQGSKSTKGAVLMTPSSEPGSRCHYPPPPPYPPKFSKVTTKGRKRTKRNGKITKGGPKEFSHETNV